MSIPNPFRPVCGTLEGGYVQEGLLLCILSEMETTGNTLTNTADGAVYQSVSHTKLASGAIAFNLETFTSDILPRGIVPFSPDNTIEFVGHVKKGSILFDCYVSNRDVAGKAVLTKEYGQFNLNKTNQTHKWSSYITSSVFDKAYHFCWNSDDSHPLQINANEVPFVVDGHTWGDAANTLLSTSHATQFDCYAIRIYNRKLTLEEVNHNFAIDKRKYAL